MSDLRLRDLTEKTSVEVVVRKESEKPKKRRMIEEEEERVTPRGTVTRIKRRIFEEEY